MTTTEESTVLDLLIQQHTRIRSLFSQVRDATGEHKQDLFHQLVRLQAKHESAEEQVVHPAARRVNESGEQVVRQALDEENDAKRALAELYDLGVEHPEFDARLTTFGNAVIEHAEHEERDEFTYLRSALSDERLRRMAGAVRAAEAVAPTRPHPGAPESATGNLLTGPPLALFDRMRDAVRDWSRSNRD